MTSQNKSKLLDRTCPKCFKDGCVYYEVVTSGDGAFDDYHEWCARCDYERWVDGCDS